jgi:hypothetical protein
MDDVFTDEQLNIGKVLMLATRHKLKLAEIKRLTRATKVRKLKWSGNYDDVDTFVLSTMYKAIYALDNNELIGGDVYRVDGDDAVTSMLALKTSGVYKSVNLDSKNIKRLHNACLTKQSIDNTKREIFRAIGSHNDLSVVLTKQMKKNSVTKKTNALDKLLQGYADTELNLTIDKIKDIMGNTW